METGGTTEVQSGERGSGNFILGFDLSTSRCSLALGYGQEVIAERELPLDRRRTSWLIPAVTESLSEVGIEGNQLLAVSVGIGPGNFTGVRVAVATAKALGFGWQLPLLGVNSLDILAEGARPGNGVMVACLDAKREQIYCAAYRRGAQGVSRISDHMCIDPADLTEVLHEAGVDEGERIRLVGEGAIVHGEFLDREFSGAALPSDRDALYPKAADLIALATVAWERGEVAPPDSLHPVYLKRPRARLPGGKKA